MLGRLRIRSVFADFTQRGKQKQIPNKCPWNHLFLTGAQYFLHNTLFNNTLVEKQEKHSSNQIDSHNVKNADKTNFVMNMYYGKH